MRCQRLMPLFFTVVTVFFKFRCHRLCCVTLFTRIISGLAQAAKLYAIPVDLILQASNPRIAGNGKL